MYANFTEETATGTGDVITLSGATSGNIPFSASFADGDLVAYVIEDGSGVKVSGIGTYSAGTITRNDDWNYNGSVIDKNPSANIALDGSLTVRCDVTYRALSVETGSPKLDTLISAASGTAGGRDYTVQADKVYYIPFFNNSGSPINVNAMVIGIDTAGSVAARIIAGFATANNGDPYKLLFQTAEIDASSTGFKASSCSGLIPVGWSFVLLSANEDITMTAANRGSVQPNTLLGSGRSGGAMYPRNFARADRAFSALTDPFPPSTAQFDLDNIPLVGVEPV